MEVLKVCCSKVGLTISSRKTKIFTVCQADRPSQPPSEVLLRSADDQVSVVKEFEHLGSIISADCSLNRDQYLHQQSIPQLSSLYRSTSVVSKRNEDLDQVKVVLICYPLYLGVWK